MSLIITLVVFAVLLVLVQEGFRRSGKWIAWGMFLGLPVVLTPYWVQHNQQIGFFPWVKLYSILFSASWLTGLRHTSLGCRRWPLFGMLLLLVVNIVEAVVQDIFGGRLAHYLVAGAGILLIVTLPHPLHTIRIDTESHHRDLHYQGMGRVWIVEYTLWNWAFLYLNFPAIAGQHLAVLASAFVVGMIDPRRWLQARVYTLAADLLLLATFPKSVVRWLDTSHWSNPQCEILVAATCLSIMAAYAVWLIVGLNHLLATSRRAWDADRDVSAPASSARCPAHAAGGAAIDPPYMAPAVYP